MCHHSNHLKKFPLFCFLDRVLSTLARLTPKGVSVSESILAERRTCWPGLGTGGITMLVTTLPILEIWIKEWKFMSHPVHFSNYHSLMLSRCYCGALWAWHSHAAHHCLPQSCHVTIGVWAQIVETLHSGVRAPTKVRDWASVTHTVLWGWSNGCSGGGDNVSRGEGVYRAWWGGAVHEGALQQVYWGKSLLSRVIQHTALELD